MVVNVREHAAGLVRVEFLFGRMQELLKELEGMMDEEKKSDTRYNRYGNTLYLEMRMLDMHLQKELGEMTEEEKVELEKCTFTEEEKIGIACMKPSFDVENPFRASAI